MDLGYRDSMVDLPSGARGRIRELGYLGQTLTTRLNQGQIDQLRWLSERTDAQFQAWVANVKPANRANIVRLAKTLAEDVGLDMQGYGGLGELGFLKKLLKNAGNVLKQVAPAAVGMIPVVGGAAQNIANQVLNPQQQAQPQVIYQQQPLQQPQIFQNIQPMQTQFQPQQVHPYADLWKQHVYWHAAALNAEARQAGRPLPHPGIPSSWELMNTGNPPRSDPEWRPQLIRAIDVWRTRAMAAGHREGGGGGGMGGMMPLLLVGGAVALFALKR